MGLSRTPVDLRQLPSAMYERITQFFVSQLAYLAARLLAMPEGGSTVLDNTCQLWLSCMFSGSVHDNTKLPILTLGGLGGTLATGRVLNCRSQGDENRKVCSLYLSLMDQMELPRERFGDADARLVGLWGRKEGFLSRKLAPPQAGAASGAQGQETRPGGALRRPQRYHAGIMARHGGAR